MAGMLEEFLVLHADSSSSCGYIGATNAQLVDLDQLKEAARATLECENLEFIEFTMPKGARCALIVDAQAAEKGLPVSPELTKFINKYFDPLRSIQGSALLFRNKCWEDE